MSGDVGLDEALELLDGSLTNRKKGLEDLTRILRVNQRNVNATSLADETYQTIYQVLFELIRADRSIWLSASARYSTTQATTADRLLNLATAVRLAVELGIRSISKETISSIIRHVLDTISVSRGGLCVPLALGYIRCLRAIASRQRHVEHLLSAEWSAIIQFCLDTLKEGHEYQGDARSGAEQRLSPAPALGLSHRSSRSGTNSRSQLKEFSASQESRAATKQIMDEIVATLALLSAVPNAPLPGKAQAIMKAMVDFLKSNPISRVSHQDSFVAINSVLQWSTTDNLDITKGNTTQLLRLIQHFWPTRVGGLRDEMLITLIYLQPYMSSLARQEQSPTIWNELSGLFEILRSEYSKRDHKDRLRLDHLRLAFSSTKKSEQPDIGNTLFALHSAGVTQEHSWAAVSILATVTGLLELQSPDGDELNNETIKSEPEDNNDIYEETARRPRKRQRLNHTRKEILAGVNIGSVGTKVCSLQVLSFVAQQQAMNNIQLGAIVDCVAEVCNDASAEVVTWAFVALCSCALQQVATGNMIEAKWQAVWTMACRALSDVDSCRAASHLLCVLIYRRVVPQSSIAELIQAIATSMDTSGPSIAADSVFCLLDILLERSWRLNPGSSSALKESILQWLSRRYTPSMFDDKIQCHIHFRTQPSDIVRLINACIGHSCHRTSHNELRCWTKIGQAWTVYRTQDELIAYLLLEDRDHDSWLANLDGNCNATQTSLQIGSIQDESIVLTRYISDVQKAQELWLRWRDDRARSIGSDRVVFLYQAICTIAFSVYDSAFQDERRQLQLKELLEKLLFSVVTFLSTTDCTQEIFDNVITSATCHLPGLHVSDTRPAAVSQAQDMLCCHLSLAIQGRRREQASYGKEIGDMDLDDEFESQHSRNLGDAGISCDELGNDAQMKYSILALRANTALYALAVSSTVSFRQDTAPQSQTPARMVVDYIKSLSAADLIASRATLAVILQHDVPLDNEIAYTLLDDLADRILEAEEFDRSEPALCTILTVMSSLLPLLIQTEHEKLLSLGQDAYNYFVDAVEHDKLSAEGQRHFAAYLLQVCNIDADYGSEGAVQSARTSLFKLVQKGKISVQFYLANNVHSIFGHYVLSAHNQIFDDLQKNLTDEFACTEGLAIRLMYLSRLGAAWHTLLRQCVYYIFETAGLVKIAGSYAARCISELTTALGFDSAQRLFRLFASQLLYTWLAGEKRTLNSLPYAAFRYANLEELLRDNEAEVTAQLLMRGRDDGLHIMAKCVGVPPKDLALRSFAKIAAYTIAWDITDSSSTGVTNAAQEGKLRQLVGGKETEISIMAEQFPVIVGNFHASMQQEDVEDQWLEKRAAYGAAAKALARIKSHSYSARQLPLSQQPSFKSKFLPDQIERLCRRTGHDPVQPWDASSFALAARMLIDSIDRALGPLHSSQVLRKLRILISTAGNIACSGFPLQMLLHSIRPFLSESHCADDALGILKYLLEQGQSYLETEDPSLMHGFICVVILQMRAHSTTRQDSTTQETQHRETVQRMEAFQAWLVQYVARSSMQSGAHPDRTLFAKILETVHLPGTAQKDTAESALLLVLLRQLSQNEPLMERSRCIEALSLLTADFEVPMLIQEDCLNDGAACAQYADSLWLLSSLSKPGASFASWSGGVLGRAYAYTGVRRMNNNRDPKALAHAQKTAKEPTASSRATILRSLTDLLMASDRAQAGLADWTLRTISSNIEHDAERLAFEKMLPRSLVYAIQHGAPGYVPHTARAHLNIEQGGRSELRLALLSPNSVSDRDWCVGLASALCRLASHVPLLASLNALLASIAGLAEGLLPSIVHLVLADEIDREQISRIELSSALAQELGQQDEASRSRQRLLIRLVLYLRWQSWPGEATKADRIQWLEVDLLSAARAASRCGLPNAALLLAESIPPTTNNPKRSSGRVSLSQLQPAGIPNELLLSIFKQVEEPDSFYGVQQTASLGTVIERLDYEGNGLNSLMYQSAQMDGAMRSMHSTSADASMAMMPSLNAMDLHGLRYALLAGPLANTASSSAKMFDAARQLQQWDIQAPQNDSNPAAIRFSAFQELSRASDRAQIGSKLTTLLSTHVQHQLLSSAKLPSVEWYNTLASISGILDVVRTSGEQALKLRLGTQDGAQYHIDSARVEGTDELADDRATICSVLSRNLGLLRDMHFPPKAAKLFEAQALLSVAQMARKSDNLQKALSASTQLTLLSQKQQESGFRISAATALETSSVLWATGELEASVKMLKDVLAMKDSESQDLPVGESGVLAIIAGRLAEARLERPDDILQSYLKPAIEQLKGRTDGREAGNVFHAFATFCDQQLQNPSNIEEFSRISRMRQKKLKDLNDLETITKSSRKSSRDLKEAEQAERKARSWFEMDDEEYQKLSNSRDGYIHQSLQNYLRALHASNEHDISLLRFFAMWLENCDSPQANEVVARYLGTVPSWKFVVLNNQLMSRLASERTPFQTTLSKLITRIGVDHPHHIVHHIFAATRKPNHDDDLAAMSRWKAAQSIRHHLEQKTTSGPLLTKVFSANKDCQNLAWVSVDGINSSKVAVKDFPAVNRFVTRVKSLNVPPTIISIPLRPDRKYDNVPLIAHMDQVMGISGGISKPKSLGLRGTDGKIYKQLFKSSKNDDMRQDAIMEQIFEEASKMLRNHKTTRQRDLHVRAYKVIPLDNHSAVVEWVLNTKPIGDYLKPAHLTYYPQSIRSDEATRRVRTVENTSEEARVKEFRKICAQTPPVLRHFFLELFDDPDEWFAKRTAYTRTTAAISILGWVLGLGDRHCQNILLDEQTGEAVHIDLGVAFEAGRVLPIPEKVPFRLTRDIVDAMGVTKTEGVFRRCCEFTLEALREDKSSIMTLLNVLRYDPLVNWTVSPLRAKRMQEAMEMSKDGGGNDEDGSSKSREDEGGEAERALTVVETKLSKSLSTSATVNELIQQATDEKNLATLFAGWCAWF
ncbi:Serine/threonine-protein kinase tel1 [Recurvomyces mirabilis]|uniref:Serine/threonine-protein kinase Tel1 n=1 Tax=Recurvomyces mirabilis TaxID=574656 RepID=A0AAE0WXV6_9PEZI|nr:Serine/threonine-protein kinase tel1 [Recurvomyces mirabilis]KAK5162169.1 Serine/threonine-protein kinase tel1 [Recurvomyces mirabilis]